MQNTLNSFDLLKEVQLDIETKANPFDFRMDDLFLMGARVNPKRSFLFVSKLLGKHLEVQSDIPKLSGHLLSNLFVQQEEGGYFSDIHTLVEAVKTESVTENVKEELNRTHTLHEKVLFLGFAETATGIGHAVFSAFQNAHYVHTTREEFTDKESVFNFQEEHSHATDHLCYLLDKSVIEDVSHIVLVDDEVTTGNTCLNLIRSLNEVYPNKRYTIMSLLDWRTSEQEEAYTRFQEELGIRIDSISLLRGSVELVKNTVFEQELVSAPIEIKSKKPNHRVIYRYFKNRVTVSKQGERQIALLKGSGRFGMSSDDNEQMEAEAQEVGTYLKDLRRGEKTLCVGHGEFMYTPSRIASHMGESVAYKSSTRSPIYVSDVEGYPVHDRIDYQINNGVTNYLYNLQGSGFDEVIMFFENGMDNKTLNQIAEKIQSKGIEHVSFVMV